MLNNDFSDLLKYLEKQSKVEKNIKEKVISNDLSVIKNNNLITKKETIKDPQILSTKDCFDVKIFEHLMREELKKEYLQSLKWERPYISVGELLICPRKVYYSRQKLDINLDNEFKFSYLYLINNVGKKVHDIIQKIYKFDEVEVKVINEKYKVKGRVDAIKGDTVIEIKTVDPEKFPLTDVIEDHYNQAIIYSYILNNNYKKSINNISIVYVSRNLKNILNFNLNTNDKKAEEFLSKSLLIKKCLEEKTPPLSSTIKNNSECIFCSYTNFCKNDNNLTSKNNVIESKYVDLL